MRSIKTIIRKKSKSSLFVKGFQIAQIISLSRLILNDFFPEKLRGKFEIYYFNLKTKALTIKTFNPLIASEIRLNESKIQSIFKKKLKINLKKILIKNY